MTATPVAATAPATAEYRLALRGAGGEAIHLRTSGVPAAWMVSFCTPKVCRPYTFDDRLPPTGLRIVDVRVFALQHQRTQPPSFVIDAGEKRVLIIGR